MCVVDKNDASWLYYYDSSRSRLTVRGFAQRGIYNSNVSHKTKISKQLDDF